MEHWVSLKDTFVALEGEVSEDISLLLEELTNFIHQRVVFPVNLHAHNSDINFTVRLPIGFSMNVYV